MAARDEFPRQGGPVPSYARVFTLDKWDRVIDDGIVDTDHGAGWWVKGGRFLTGSDWEASVWRDPPTGATHVAWFNK